MNKLIHGTWQNELPKIADNSVDLIIIDPPYLVTKEKWDKEDQVTEVLSKHLFRILKPTGNFYCWGGRRGEVANNHRLVFNIQKYRLVF